MRKYLLILFVFSVLSAQSTFSGLGAYYNVLNLASAGPNGASMGLAGGLINPSAIVNIEEQVQANIIKYPANIYAECIEYGNSFKNHYVSASLRRMDYGKFSKIDENGIANGTYNASDNLVKIAFAGTRGPLFCGIAGGVFLSNIGSYNSAAIVYGFGVVYNVETIDLKIGLSVNNFGVYLKRYTDYKEKLPKQLTFSLSKELKYLPLQLNSDLSYFSNERDVMLRLGGIFNLPYNFKLIFGINSNNIYQATEYQDIKSIFGSTGIGLSFGFDQYKIDVGGLSYGSGGWIYGTSINIKL